MPIAAKFFQRFRHLKPDAQPRRPSDTEGVPLPDDISPPPSRTVNSLDYQQDDDCKKPKDEPKAEKKEGKKNMKPTTPSPPSPPIHTQAQGNVIHVINSNGVHFGPNITNYMNTPTPPCQPADAHEPHEEIVTMTPAIESVMESDDEPKHKHLECVSRNMSRDWRSFFRAMGYTQGHIDTVLETESGDVKEARYNLLLDWKQTADENSLGALATALWREGERVVVRELALIDS